MQRRIVCAHKKEVHLTILADCSLEEFQKTVGKIQTAVEKHNHCLGNTKISYDIIYAESPERRVSGMSNRRRIKANFFEKDTETDIDRAVEAVTHQIQEHLSELNGEVSC